MRNLIKNGFNIQYGKKANREGLYASIVDTSVDGPIGKLPYVIIRCDETDADARTMLLITIGEEIRYLQMCEVDPKTPNTEKTLELRI